MCIRDSYRLCRGPVLTARVAGLGHDVRLLDREARDRLPLAIIEKLEVLLLQGVDCLSLAISYHDAHQYQIHVHLERRIGFLMGGYFRYILVFHSRRWRTALRGR